MKLWGRLTSCNVQKALWALEEMNLRYERIDAGGDFGGLDDPAYLAMNPHGQVPTLQDGDLIVWESDAIGARFKVLGRHLGNHRYFAGDRFGRPTFPRE